MKARTANPDTARSGRRGRTIWLPPKLPLRLIPGTRAHACRNEESKQDFYT